MENKIKDPDATIRLTKEKFNSAILSAERYGFASCANLLFSEEAEIIFGIEVRKIGQWLTEKVTYLDGEK